MDIRQLRYFIAVAENLNFTEAAKQLFVAQSAVSQQIADLESKLGVKLFDRNKRTVKLTNAGYVLLEEAINLVNKSEEAIKKTRQADMGIIGNLSIGFLGYTEKNILPYLIRQFRNNYPKIDLHLDQYTHGTLIESLNTGELDIVFTLGFGVDEISGIDKRSISTETISIVMNCDHPLAHKPSIKISELSNEKLIVLSRKESPQGFNQTLLICANHGFSPNIVAEPRLLSTALILVDAGIGIAILPKSLKDNASKSLCFIDIEGEKIEHEIVVAWKKNNANPSISLFLEELESVSHKFKQI